jgi:D-serine deaminase-like pyridoxal phosphate-dependent protein
VIPGVATPVPVVDLGVVAANVARVAGYARAHGLALRPHVKTHKSVAMAARQMAAGAVGLTCATPHELHVMRAASADLLWAFPAADAARLAQVAALPSDTVLTVLLDSVASADALAAAVRGRATPVRVLVERDVGLRRTGVPDDATLVAVAAHVARTPGLAFVGLGFYPGHIREARDAQAPALARLAETVEAAIAALTAAGLPPAVVSGGSTPTVWDSHALPGLTEIRPGTTIYNDRTTALIGACALAECAVTVLATVVSTSVSGQAVVDAGTKALGREPIRGADGEGWACVQDRPEIVVTRMSEEHGVLDLSGTDWRPRVGDQVRLVPNHVCIVTHLFDAAVAVEGGAVAGRLSIDARGR